jgi:polyhydroxybutyrate depolymerase
VKRLLLLACVLTMCARGRQYHVHVPPHPAAHPALVIVFHGHYESADTAERDTRFDALADREGFLVAYPSGVARSWNDGRGITRASKKNVDDVGFVRRIIGELRAKYDVDPNRIYATGISNGGMFANRLACDMPDVLAAIGTVVGPMPTNVAHRCHATIPVLGIQSTADPLVDFNGGRGVEGSRATQALWARLDGCAPEPRVETLPARIDDGTSVTKRTFTSCRADVVWYEIAGGGHRWPGSRESLVVKKVLGKASANLDASAVIWEFFKAHPRSSPAQ